MLNNINVLIIGGDARYIEVINGLNANGANIFLVGFDQLSFDDPKISKLNLNEVDYHNIDAITLPVAGTSKAGKVDITYSDNKDIFLTKEIISQTPEHCVIYTGTTNSFLTKLAESNNRKLVSLFDRNDIAILNSIPTAEGALQIAQEKTDITIHGSNVMVLGFGRVGKTVARLFSSVGAKVSVCVRSSADIARIIEMGLEPIDINSLELEIGSVDICINTIPYPVINTKVISAMDCSSIIIDLASAPGGTDFEYAKKQNITAIHALGLPGKIAPKSAGEIIASVLIQLVTDENKSD